MTTSEMVRSLARLARSAALQGFREAADAYYGSAVRMAAELTDGRVERVQAALDEYMQAPEASP